MTEQLTLKIRETENGFVATFGETRFSNTWEKEFVAMSPTDLRKTVSTELEKRLGDMIDRLVEKSSRLKNKEPRRP